MSLLAKHVIIQFKPLFWFSSLLAVIIIASTIQWYMNQDSTLILERKKTVLEQQLQDLQHQLETEFSRNRKLASKNKMLQSKLIKQEHHLAIQKATAQQLQQQIIHLQNNAIALNKELVFYKTIMQGTTTNKLQIREIQLTRHNNIPNSYHYKVAITQGQKVNEAFTGTININVNIEKDGQQKSPLLEAHPLNLRYVQVIEGKIKLANNAIPKSMMVTIKQKKKPDISKIFNWPIETTQQIEVNDV